MAIGKRSRLYAESAPSWERRPRGRDPDALVEEVAGSTAVSLVMASSLGPQGTSSQPAAWPIRGRAGPTALCRSCLHGWSPARLRGVQGPRREVLPPARVGPMPVSEHRRSRRSWTTVVLAVLLLVVGCTTRDAPGAKPPQDDGRDAAAQVTPAVPAQSLTVVADADPQAAAVSASRALYRSAGVAVVAADGDAAGTLLGASAAVGLGVPLLLAGPGGLAADPVGGELDRLGVGSVLAVGDVPAEARDGGPEVVAVPARADAVAAAAGIRLAPTASVDDGGQAAAIAGLHLREPSALRPSGGTASAPSAPGQESRLPEFVRPRPLRSVVVLADGGSASPPAVATARAPGASVVVTGGTHPRASTDAIGGLSADSTEAVVALGAGFAGAPDLGWQVDTARTGTSCRAAASCCSRGACWSRCTAASAAARWACWGSRASTR